MNSSGQNSLFLGSQQTRKLLALVLGCLIIGMVITGCAQSGKADKSNDTCDPSVDTKRCVGLLSIQVCDPASKTWQTEEICTANQSCSGTGETSSCASTNPTDDIVDGTDVNQDAESGDVVQPTDSLSDAMSSNDTLQPLEDSE